MTEDPRETPEYRRQTHEYWEREFGEAVRHIRQKRGWSQRELADRVAEEGFALHQTGIAKIERGARPLRVAEAAAIATVLGIPTLAVFYGVNQEIGRLELEEEANHIRRRIDTARRVVQYAGALYARAEADMVTLVAKAEAAQFDPSGPRPKPGAEFDSVDDPRRLWAQ
ncbi:helix-turn-helix domain-containing protein [Mycolicibacterium fortuitum]|nr:helix-turn-helix domain-containing protein [Mycolicibacterium fortuitum]